MQLVQVVASLPNTILATVDVARHPGQTNVPHQLQEEVAACYIALYYYTALANVLAQNILPPEEQFNRSDSFHANVRGFIDNAAADFDRIANLLNGLDRSLITNSSLRHLFDTTLSEWQPHVRYTSQVFTSREASGE
jgi:hypothetical protein